LKGISTFEAGMIPGFFLFKDLLFFLIITESLKTCKSHSGCIIQSILINNTNETNYFLDAGINACFFMQAKGRP